jgi:hypothetical protein
MLIERKRYMGEQAVTTTWERGRNIEYEIDLLFGEVHTHTHSRKEREKRIERERESSFVQ